MTNCDGEGPLGRGEKQIIACFDLDGTLTEPRLVASVEMLGFLRKLRASGVQVALVSGSDLPKLTEQFGGEEALRAGTDWVFAENGVVAYREGEKVSCHFDIDFSPYIQFT
jgi:phosphomannomutase